MLRATRIRFTPWKDWQIRWFIRRYGVDVSIATDPDPASYPDFNTFFTRALAPGARPLESGPRAIVSPADGTVAEAGSTHGRQVVRAKSRDYTLEALFGGDESAAAEFEGGRFATIYLSPRDYHRVHMPLTGRLRSMVYVPGELFSVNPGTVDAIGGLFAPQRARRLVLRHRSRAAGGNAGRRGLRGCIEQVWRGVVTPPRRREAVVERYDDAGIVLEQGREMGRFNMGSTVILILANHAVEWVPWMAPGAPVRMGQRIGGVPSGDRSSGREVGPDYWTGR